MIRRSLRLLHAKTLRVVINQFKRAGAHPDMIQGIDPVRASHNGSALMDFERLLNERSGSANHIPAERRAEKHSFVFWIKRQGGGDVGSSAPQSLADQVGSAADEPSDRSNAQLRKLECTLTPFAADSIVKHQLKRLFQGAGISDDFELPGEVTNDFGSVLQHVHVKHEEYMSSAQGLFSRGERVVNVLRSFGVVIGIREDEDVFLVTMPEDATENGIGQRSLSMLQRTKDMDPAVQDFLRQRNLSPFDFSMGGSIAAVEHLVKGAEQLHSIYVNHQGTCVRPGVFYLLSSEARANYVAQDGCVVLAALLPHTWIEFLLSLTQGQWRSIVKAQADWRGERPLLLLERQRQLARLGDALHLHTVMMHAPPGSNIDWPQRVVDLFLKEEAAIRRTVQKYSETLKRDVLKKRASLVVYETLTPDSIPRPLSQKRLDSGEKGVACRILPDGKICVGANLITPPVLLKQLRDNSADIQRRIEGFDKAVSSLEHLSRIVCIHLNVDKLFRTTDPNLLEHLDHFIKTVERVKDPMALRGQQLGGKITLMVSDHFSSTASGIAKVPWNVDGSTLLHRLLPQR